MSVFLQALCCAAPALSMDQAVAMAVERNRSVVAATLHVSETEVEKVAVGLLENPELEYSIGNLVLGQGNDQERDLHPTFLEQSAQAIGVTQVLDIWLKRRARVGAATAGVREAHLGVEDAVREVQFAVRAAFAEVVREQWENALAHEARARYDQTVQLSRRRREAGDIAEAELRKIELEGLKYLNAQYDADLQLHMARHNLAQLLALDDVADLPQTLEMPALAPPEGDADTWAAHALAGRPDLRALRVAEERASLDHRAAERDAYPDLTVGLAYVRSNFQISGDNPRTLGATISMPIPIFDRNQAGIEAAAVGKRTAANTRVAHELQIRREVHDAARKLQRARSMLATFEEGKMLERADNALSLAEKSYAAGAISFLEILEAQRAYLETRAHYLTIRDDYYQAVIEVAYVTGGEFP